MGIGHVHFVPVYRPGEEAGRTVIEKRNALNYWESFRGVGYPLHGLVFHKVGVDRLGIEVIVFGEVEAPIFIYCSLEDRFGLAILFGLPKGQLAEMPCGGVVCSCARVVADEVERDACELKVAASSQKPYLMVVGDRQDIPQVDPGLLCYFFELPAVGVDVEIGPPFPRGTLMFGKHDCL